MSTAAQTYQGWQLNQRPNGEPTEQCFAWVTGERPTPKQGELLLRTEYLSIDPYMRGRMDDGESYAPPVQLGDVMVGGQYLRLYTLQYKASKKVIGYYLKGVAKLLTR